MIAGISTAKARQFRQFHYNFQACKASNVATQRKAERPIVHFTVTLGENEAGVDRLLIQPISFIIVIMFFLC